MIRTATSSAELEYDDRPVVVCFTNSLTCAPCRAFKPHYLNVASTMEDRVDFFEVDIIDSDGFALAQEFGVQGTPTVLLIDDQGRRPLTARATMPLIGEINERLG